MRMRRNTLRLLGLVVAAVLVGAGCGGALRQPLRVVVDDANRVVSARSPEDPTEKKNVPVTMFAFLPAELPMKPGQEAFFTVRSRDEPHTITLGTMIDDAARAIEALGPDATVEQIEAVPEMQAIPSVFPQQPAAGGTPQVNGSAAEPCYLDEGAPPTSPTGDAPRCEERRRPEFNGRQAFWNTGWLNRDDSITLEVSGDIKPGSYAIMCLIHRSQMMGTLEVLKSGESLPRVGEYDDAGERAVDRIGDELSVSVGHVVYDSTPDSAVAGAGVQGVSGVLTTFGQRTYGIPVGGTVSWSVHGTHTITFDAPTGNKNLLVKRDGRVQLNPNVWEPTGSPPLPPAAQSLAAPGAEPVVVEGGAYDGHGPHNSGVLRSVGAPPVTYRLTFSEPGTYRYLCLIHPLMAGKVKVG